MNITGLCMVLLHVCIQLSPSLDDESLFRISHHPAHVWMELLCVTLLYVHSDLSFDMRSLYIVYTVHCI